MKPIVPALIPASLGDLKTALNVLTFSPEIHIDLVDGKFVPAVSWPYVPAGTPSEIQMITDHFTLEVDLMVEDPMPAAEAWVAAGADMLVFHTETISLETFQSMKRLKNVSYSVSALNDTPLSELLAYAQFADAVQLMGIAKIGAQGQPFDSRVLERIKAVKQAFPLLPVTIDGSVNKDTITALSAAGADRFICGSAIVGVKDKAAAYTELRALAN